MVLQSQPSPLPVVHSLPVWLPRTATYLYNQVRYLPPEIANYIVCATTQNLDQFTVKGIHSLDADSPWRHLSNLALRKLGVRRFLGHLVPIAKHYHAKILHSHWGDVAWRDMSAAKKASLLHIVTFYGKDVNYLPQYQPRWRQRYQELFRHVNLVLCEGTHMARCIVALGCPAAKVRVQHLGVEVARILFQPRAWNRSEPLRVLISASFREKKGIPYALKALARLANDVPQLEITIIGDASADSRSIVEKTEILRTLEEYQLMQRTRLLGYQPHAVLFAEAYKHHIFISPSITAGDGDTEGGAPVTIIEMAATGMPIVSTKHCDIPSVVIHGETGFLAAERDADGLLSYLRWLAEHPDQWYRITEKGRLHIEAEYDVVRQCKRLAQTYLKLARGSVMGNDV